VADATVTYARPQLEDEPLPSEPTKFDALSTNDSTREARQGPLQHLPDRIGMNAVQPRKLGAAALASSSLRMATICAPEKRLFLT